MSKYVYKITLAPSENWSRGSLPFVACTQLYGRCPERLSVYPLSQFPVHGVVELSTALVPDPSLLRVDCSLLHE